MVCPKCESQNLKVIEKRDTEIEPAIRRRRECNDCGFRFTTYERLEVPTLVVIKKDGHKEQFSRDKLAGGIQRALEKRPIEEADTDRLITEIEKEVHATGANEIASEKIGDLVMTNLLAIDEVAYLRFASVYKKFETLEAFQQELSKINK